MKAFATTNRLVIVLLFLLAAIIVAIETAQCNINGSSAYRQKSSTSTGIKVLNKNTSKMLARVRTTFPELNESRKREDGIFVRLFHLLKGMADGSIQPLQVISSTQSQQQNSFIDVKDVHKYLEKPTLIAVIANELPKRRMSSSIEPHLFQLGKSFRAQEQQLKKSIFSRIILPYMNRMGEIIEKRSGKNLYPITFERLPNRLAKRELMAVWDMGSGTLFIHNKFYEQFVNDQDFEDSISEESLIEFYENILKSGIPTDFSKEGLMRAIRGVPETLSHLTARPSAICLACLIVLSLFMPFLVNYVCYYLAQAICAALKLPFDTCIDVEVGSLILAFILTFPTALFVWRLCHATICGKSMTIAYKTGMMTLAAGFVYIKTMFGNLM